MNLLLPSLRIYFFLTLATGLIYPVLVTVLGQAAFSEKANGSLIERGGQLVGSRLIAQKFESGRYFWPRPSATDYNPLPSGGSNLGPTSDALKEAFASRKSRLGLQAPTDMMSASGSGLDPEISPKAAMYQIPRIAQARGMPEDKIRHIVESYQLGRQLGVLGEERINVLQLNLALDGNE